MSPRVWFAAVGLCAAPLLGCGEIREVPVELSSSSGGPTSSDGGTADSGDTVDTGSSTAPSNDDEVDKDPTSSTTEPSGASEDGPDPPDQPPTEWKMQCTSMVYAIPDDGTWLELELPVKSSDGTLAVAVGVRVQHAVVSQLEMSVVGPEGLTVPLLDHPDCPGQNISAVFDDNAKDPGPCTGSLTSAIEGTIMPLEPMSPLLDEILEGTWTLRLRDSTAGDTGTIEQFCLLLEVEAP